MMDTKARYTGKIRQVEIGTGEKMLQAGGQNCFNFHQFEGETPHIPAITYEVWDNSPEWPEACRAPYGDVLSNPEEWAKKCVGEYGAKALTIQLASTDPNGLNKSASDAGTLLEKILKAVDIPLIIWGCDNPEKDAETMKVVAEVCEGRNVALGPCVDKNYKQIGAAAIAYKHSVVASSPIDVNLAKQLNILLMELGVPENKIIMDPTTGALGYGIEYTYSVMERNRIAALQQEDEKLAFPMLCNLAKEVWKIKEVSLSSGEYPEMGDEKKRGIMLESLTAGLLALAGADILVMRHPESVKLLEQTVTELTK